MNDISRILSGKLMERCDYGNLKRRYMTLQTDQERVRLILSLLRDEKILSLLPPPSNKSLTVSESYRRKGTELFIAPSSALRLDTTMHLYTKSIIFAPPGSRELALGYANRSAASFAARLYQDCLADISRALALPYPDNLRAKLYVRRARCLMTLKSRTKDQEEQLNEAFKMSAEYVEKMGKNSRGRVMIEKMLQEPDKMIPPEDEYIKWQSQALMPELLEANPEMKGVSSALKFEFDGAFGRYVVAARDIEAGEVVAIMKPYVAILVAEKRLTHCDYCMEQTWSSVPCESCCEVVYCNEDCRKCGYHKYHDVECQAARHLIALNIIYTSLLNLRLTVTAVKEAGSIDNLREFIQQIEDQTEPRTVKSTQHFPDRNYGTIYTMIRNTEKREFIDLFEKTLKTCLIVLALAAKSNLFGSKFFTDVCELEDEADVTFLAGLIMRHQQIISSNAYNIYEEDPLQRMHFNPIPKGGVLIPFSQMSHSCSPGITKVGYGMNIVFYTNYASKKGEQIYDNYGQLYTTTPRDQRQTSLLKGYHFFCNCVACTENWPTYPDLPSARNLPFEVQQRLTNALSLYHQYYEIADNGVLPDDVATVIAHMNNMVRVLQETVGLPCGELVDVINLRKRILRLTGNRLQSLNSNI